MNASIKAALKNPQTCCLHFRSAFFHSTPFLERGRRNNRNSRYNNNNSKTFGRYRRSRFKEHTIRDTEAYVEYMFESWDSDFRRDEQPSKKGPSWFHRSNNGSKRSKPAQGPQNKGRRGFSFCEDDDDPDVETFFRSAFGDRFCFWSFVNDGSNRRRSSRHSNSYKSSWRWRDQSEDEYDYTTEDDSRRSTLVSERTTLGLSASGPLKLEDVKNAYRASALKWHPDRHQGSSKAAAEEKFKVCTAAYQSLCDSLAVN